MKNILLLTVLIFAPFIPYLTSAHTKWFAEGDLEKVPLQPDFFLCVAILGIIGTLITVFAIELHQRNKLRLCFLEHSCENKYQRAAYSFTMIC